MRYLVTGGAGFIGSNTVDELVRRGHSVVVLDDLSAGKEENLAEVRSKITFVKGSIIDMEAVQKAIHQAEYVIHLAARTSVPRSVKGSAGNQPHQRRWHPQRARRRPRQQGKARRPCCVLLRLRRNSHAAEDRIHAAEADLTLRCHQIRR